MSLCAGRMKELKGDLIRDERKVVTPLSPIFFFQTFAQNLDTSSGSNHILCEQWDIYGLVPTAKANIMSFHSTIHIVLPPVACGEE